MSTNDIVADGLELLTDRDLEAATGGKVEMWSTEPVPAPAYDAAPSDCEAMPLA